MCTPILTTIQIDLLSGVHSARNTSYGKSGKRTRAGPPDAGTRNMFSL